MIIASEISRRRVNTVKRLLRKGKEEVLRVLRVDPTKGYIDLSKKAVKPDEIKEFKKFYSKSSAVHTIMKMLSLHTKKPINELYEQIAWPLYAKYGHAFDAFKILVQDESSFNNMGIKVEDEVKEELFKILKKRMEPQPVRIRADFKITCLTFEGIEGIKSALISGQSKGTEKIPITFKVIGSPLYECTVITPDKEEGFKVVESSIKEVERVIKEKGGNFLMRMNPKIIGEEEENMKEQLKMAEKENEESEEEENQEGIQADIENVKEDEKI